MKRFLALVPVLLIAACGGQKSANQHKAEKLVVDYLRKTPAVSASYQSIGFDTLREQHDQYLTADEEGRKLDSIATAFSDSAVAYRKKSDDALMAKDQDRKKARVYATTDSIFAIKSDSVSAIIQQKSKAYKSEGFRYIINHTYKINNNVGHLTQHTTTFWLDRDLTKIERTQEAN